MTQTSGATDDNEFAPPIKVEGELLVLSQFVDKVRAAPQVAGLIVGDIVELDHPEGEYGNDAWAQVVVAVASGVASGVALDVLRSTWKPLMQWAKRNGLRWSSEDPPDSHPDRSDPHDPDAPARP